MIVNYDLSSIQSKKKKKNKIEDKVLGKVTSACQKIVSNGKVT